MIPGILAVLLLFGQGYLVVGRNFATVLETPFLPYCMIGSFAIHAWTRPERREFYVTVALAVCAAFWFMAFSGRFHLDWPTSIACGSFFGLASLAVLAVQVMRTKGESQKRKVNTLIAGSVFGYSAIVIAYILDLTTKLHPQTYDLYLYAADAGLGIPVCAWAGRFVGTRPVLLHACSFIYESLPLAVSLLYAYQRSGRRKLPVRVLPAFIGGGAAAYVLYNLLPAAGPRYVFGAAFPDHLPQTGGLHLTTLGNVARNAVPSMHLACALLLFWACRPLGRWVRGAAALFLLLTIFATLGFGEHYVVDLVAAVPYALALAAICRNGDCNRAVAALGVALTLLWIALLRFGVPLFHSPAFTWSLTVGTLVLCSAAQRKLQNISL